MSQFLVTREKTFVAGGAIAEHLLVKLAAGKISVAALGEQPIGVLDAEAFADGNIRAVTLLSAQGTVKMVAAAAIVQGAKVFGRAAGQVDDDNATSAVLVGIAMETAAAQGDIVEVMLL